MKESALNIKKVTEEKKDINSRLVESTKCNNDLEQKLCNIQKHLEDTEQLLKGKEEEAQLHIRENNNILEGNIKLLKFFICTGTVNFEISC